MCAWFGNCSVAQKTKLDRIVKTCRKLGLKQINLTSDLYKENVVKKASDIKVDSLYVLMRSGQRFRAVYARTTRYRNSFVPTSVRFLNELN